MEKILITATTYPLDSEDTQPRFIHDLAKSLQEHLEVTVLTPSAPGAPKEQVIDGIRVLRYPYFINRFQTLTYRGGILENLKQNPLNFLLIPFLLLSQFFFLLRHTKHNHYDVLHAHWIIPQGLVATILKKFTKREFRLIVTAHGGDLYALQGKFLNRIKRWTLEHADISTVVSNAMRQHCHEQLGVSSSTTIQVRSMGVDLKSRFHCTNSFDQRAGIIFVGRIAEKKGLDVLIEAMSILKKQGINEPLTIIGDGPDLNQIRQRTRQLQLEELVTFTGSLKNNEIPALLNKHKIFIMPSIIAKSGDQEGLGLVAIEAMGCGCAVIASELKAVRDVVEHNVNGLLFTPGNAQQLADSILSLLSDHRHMEALAKAGIESAISKFDWTQVASDYRRIYFSDPE